MANHNHHDHARNSDMEKLDTGSNHISNEEQLRNVLTNTMSISPELFERLYLGPQNRVSGDLRKTFANPTPLGVLGFAVGLFPLSIELSMYSDRNSRHAARPSIC